jgi:hypothetical protein
MPTFDVIMRLLQNGCNIILEEQDFPPDELLKLVEVAKQNGAMITLTRKGPPELLAQIADIGGKNVTFKY